jgi:hypothetical protein
MAMAPKANQGNWQAETASKARSSHRLLPYASDRAARSLRLVVRALRLYRICREFAGVGDGKWLCCQARRGAILMIQRWLLGVAVAVVLLGAAGAHAHPGVGIVQDREGNIFYTDLKQVWKLTREGQSSIVVPRVHTHELCLDTDNNLYGEHLWYEGDVTKKWGHRVWRLSNEGQLSDVIPAREGFLNDYSFVRDRAGNMYWSDLSDKTIIRRRSWDGSIEPHAKADFQDVRWMTATKEGILYLIDSGNLRRVSPDGKVTTVATSLSAQHPPPAVTSERHYHMGLWTNAKGDVYVAVARERLVLKIEPDGKSSVAARSPRGWSPSGGMFAKDGSLWLLEYDASNAVRIRLVELGITGKSDR